MYLILYFKYCLMEFVCVLSVGGSLASYIIKPEGENIYKAILKPGSANRDDIPHTISLEKTGDTWTAEPFHDEIITSLAHCIETAA